MSAWDTFWRSSDGVSTDLVKVERCPECGGTMVPLKMKWAQPEIESSGVHHEVDARHIAHHAIEEAYMLHHDVEEHVPFKQSLEMDEKSKHDYSVCCMSDRVPYRRAHCGTGAVLAIVTALTVLGGQGRRCSSHGDYTLAANQNKELLPVEKPVKLSTGPNLYFTTHSGAVYVDAGRDLDNLLWSQTAELPLCSTDRSIAAFTISANLLVSAEPYLVPTCVDRNSDPPCFASQGLSLVFRVLTYTGVEICRRAVDYATYIPCALGRLGVNQAPNQYTTNVRFPVAFEQYCQLPCVTLDEPLRLQAALVSTGSDNIVGGVTIKDLEWSALVWDAAKL